MKWKILSLAYIDRSPAFIMIQVQYCTLASMQDRQFDALLICLEFLLRYMLRHELLHSRIYSKEVSLLSNLHQMDFPSNIRNSKAATTCASNTATKYIDTQIDSQLQCFGPSFPQNDDWIVLLHALCIKVLSCSMHIAQQLVPTTLRYVSYPSLQYRQIDTQIPRQIEYQKWLNFKLDTYLVPRYI